jgi:phage-related protein
MLPQVRKPLIWVGSAREDLRRFPVEARRKAGAELLRLQQGLDPLNWKPMPGVGPGVAEIRIQAGTAHRVFYLARFSEGVYVLHAFAKRSRRTGQRDLLIGRQRLEALLRARRRS